MASIKPTMNEIDWEPYLPSNGTEGGIFEAKFCENCKRDRENDCSIHTHALAGLQPVEWRQPADDDEFPGKAECTAFEPYPEKEPF